MNAPWVKDPQSILDWAVNWDDGYLQSGETISASTWSIDPFVSGDLDISQSSFTDEIATVWLTGGVKGHRYRVRNKVVTSESRTDYRTITIFVRPE